MNTKEILAIAFTLIFVVVFILANWKGNQFLRLPFRWRLAIAGGLWSLLAALVLVSHVLG